MHVYMFGTCGDTARLGRSMPGFKTKGGPIAMKSDGHILPVTDTEMPTRMQKALLNRDCEVGTATRKVCKKEECHRG